jgi:hypothetical protein
MPNIDVSDVVKGSYLPHDGRIVLQPQLAAATEYQTINPPVIKGYTPNQFYSRLDSRFDRPRYYMSTPSGLPY